MNMLITVAKLPRFQFIMDNQTDKLRFIEKLVSRFKDAEEVLVVDPSGLTYNYFPQHEGETKEQALAKTPLRIPKAIVEEYNLKAQEDLAPEAASIDFDSTETLKLQLTYWIEKSVLGEEAEFSEDDIINILAVHGEAELGKFVYSIVTNGKLDPTRPSIQKRFSSPRTDVGLKITEPVDKIIEVKSLHPVEIIKAIIAKINGSTELAGEEPLLFADEILLPVTHFKDGNVYEVEIAPWALDYFGTITIKTNGVDGGAEDTDSDEGGETGEEGDLEGQSEAMVLPILSGPQAYSVAEATSAGITYNWTNRSDDYKTKVLEWSCDVEGTIITIEDAVNKSSANFKLPESVMLRDTITFTLTTDAGAVTIECELVSP